MKSLDDILSETAETTTQTAVSVMTNDGRAESKWTLAQSVEPAFLAYSITKTFIAVVVLKLRDAGKLSLDDSIARWFPHIPSASAITIRQLLSHSAGIPDYGGIKAYHDSVRNHPSNPWTFEEYAAATYEKGLLFEPGRGWMYSNVGYMLLKRIVEEVSNHSLRDVIAELISAPLKLDRTFVAETIGDLSTLSPAHSSFISNDGSPRDVRHFYHPDWVSHGVVASTASEIAAFVHALFNGHVLSAASVAEMQVLCTVPSALNKDPNFVQPSYGLGLMSDPKSRWGITYGHNGGGPGYNTSVFHAPALGGATVCVMSASESVNAQSVVFNVFDELQSNLVHPRGF